MSVNATPATSDPGADRERARRLGLYGLLAHWEKVQNQPWLPRLLEIEDAKRSRRSLERRIRNAPLSFLPSCRASIDLRAER